MRRTVDPKALGRRFAKRRNTLNISQTELARAVGMKQQGIASIERGDVKRPRFLRELAAALGTTQEWLLWEEGPENNAESVWPVWQRINPSLRPRALRMLEAFADDAAV